MGMVVEAMSMWRLTSSSHAVRRGGADAARVIGTRFRLLGLDAGWATELAVYGMGAMLWETRRARD